LGRTGHAGALYGHAGQPGAQSRARNPRVPGANVVAFGVARSGQADSRRGGQLGRSLFLSGPPGNGKTAMARALVNAVAEPLWIPYAIEVDGQVIRVFDKHVHHTVEPQESDFDVAG